MKLSRQLGLFVAGALVAGCSSTVAVPEVNVASAAEWVVTRSTFDDAVPFAAVWAISPDGNWLATALPREACIRSLTDGTEPVCVAEETIGEDTLSWSADGTRVAPSGPFGVFDTTGVWTIGVDGSATEVVPVEEGRLFEDDEVHWTVGASFRPDGESIVFVEVDGDDAAVVEVDLEGGRRELAELDPSDVRGNPILPLSDGRVVVSRGVVDNPGVDLLDDGQWTRLVTSAEDAQAGTLYVPVAVELQPVDENLVLVVVPRLAERGLNASEWSLVDFDGNEYSLAGGEEFIVAATFSPDGNHVAYLSLDPFEQTSAFHVATVDNLIEGGERLGNVELEYVDVSRASRIHDQIDPRAMRWTTDNRVLVSIPDSDVSSLLEVDLSGS